jgi:hypothetical protein
MNRSEDFYLQNPHWVEFLSSFPSGKTYAARLEHFVNWHFENKEDPKNLALHLSIEDYIKAAHGEADEDGKHDYTSGTLRGWVSVIKKWYDLTGEFAQEMVCICNRLENNWFKKWAPKEKIRKAFALESEELVMYLLTPDTEENLVRKAFAVVSKANAGRSCETHYLKEKHITFMKDNSTGKDCYLIDFERAKRRNATELTRYQGSFITGELEVDVIKRYLNTRVVKQDTLSLWRKLTTSKTDRKITMTNANIGINTTKNFGKDIAAALGLPTPERYTGHWARTTSANILIENGATIEQVMQVTGKLS